MVCLVDYFEKSAVVLISQRVLYSSDCLRLLIHYFTLAIEGRFVKV